MVCFTAVGILDVFLHSLSSAFLLGALTVILLVYFIGPPGPRPLPVLGNLLQLDLKGPYKTLLESSKKYGSVFTVYLGPNKVVILAGYRTVKEALVDYDEEFGDAQQTLEMRHFALTKLRDFGMGKRACEDKIIEECQHLIEVFKKFKAQPLPLRYISSQDN
uniref:Uncharacterized protein n=1 Tax=Maylandia zebra TaxID=106582 RepID=A0A3P9C3U9_9CICH